MKRALERVLFARRRSLLAGFVIITLAMGWLASDLRVDAGFTKLVPLEHPYMQTFLEHRASFGGADRILVAIMVRDGDIFSADFFTILRQVTDAIFFLPGVDRTQVYSILTPNVRFIEVVENGISGGNVIPPDFKPDDAGFAQVRENSLKAGLVGRLVANDFSGAAISARLQEFHPGTGERLDYTTVADQLEQIRREALGSANIAIDIHVIGFAKMIGDIAAGAARVVAFFGIAFLITALFVYAYTRSLRQTGALLACSLLAVIWQLGLLRALGFGIDPMSLLVPFLVFAIGVSHGVQIVSAVGNETARGATAVDAARRSFRRLLGPGLVALVSDAVGFVTISLIDVQVIQEVAIAAGLGVAAIILTNLGLLPILLSFIDPNHQTRSPAQRQDGLRNRFWSIIARSADRRPAILIVGIATGLAMGGAWYANQVRVGDEHRGVPELRPDSVYNTDALAISRQFSIGVDVLTVIAETIPEGCIDYDIMRTLSRFEWRMGNIEGVQSVHGLAGTAQRISAAWNEGSLKWRTLPRNRHSLVQAVSPVPTTSGLLNTDCSVMPVHIYTRDHTAETIQRVVAGVEQFNAAMTDSRIVFRLAAGNVGVMAATNEEVEASQFPILSYVYTAVVVLCLLAFRSIAATLCIVLPLAVVSLLAYALMALLEIGLKISTLPVVALGVGVGVDYGIYIFGQLRRYLRQGLDFASAYERTLKTTGAGVILTGFTLAVSVATWVIAPLKFQADMGIILMFMFLVNMIGAVVLLPALGALLIRPVYRAHGDRAVGNPDNSEPDQPDADTRQTSRR